MRTSIMALAIATLSFFPAFVSADPCKSACREHAKACKARCEVNHRHDGELRHTCKTRCDVTEHECRAKCY